MRSVSFIFVFILIQAIISAQPCLPDEKEYSLLKYYGFSPAENNWKKPIGCRYCNFSGYRGRIGIFEYLDLDEEFKNGLMQGCDLKYIKEKTYNKEQAFTLVSDALNKASQGLISLDEIRSRIPYERPSSSKLVVDKGGKMPLDNCVQ